jgi:GTPase SAR1 family protein
MLVGNKLDLVQKDPSLRQVSQEEAKALCSQQKDMKFIETSSMSNTNVQGAFEQLLQEIYQQRL